MNLLWSFLGALFFVIGGIGIFLPIWPTTVFWILAALCFARSHPGARDWIYRQPGIGPEIQSFIEQGVLSVRAKTSAIIGMSFASALCIWFLRDQIWWLAAALSLIAVGAIYVLSRPGIAKTKSSE